MEEHINDRYKNMTVEEIITDLYEQHKQDNQECLSLAKRWFLTAVLAFVLGLAITIYQWCTQAETWRWIVVILCGIVVGGALFFTLLSLLPLGFNKYEVADFHILVERALKLKYGDYTDEMLEQHMQSQFVLDFIHKLSDGIDPVADHVLIHNEDHPNL